VPGGGVVFSEDFLLHGSSEHVERPQRAQVIRAALARSPLASSVDLIAPRHATDEEIERVHPPGYAASLQDFCRAGGGYIDADTYLSPLSAQVARLAAGGSARAVEAVMSEGKRWVFSVCRPPGHHALPETAMGFCLINNAAVAARHAQKALGARRVLIVDWDVHHGNGTQDIFYDDGSVFYFSVHQSPLYPGTGRATEHGATEGRGSTLNVPLPAGMHDDDYLHVFQEALRPAARGFGPDLVIVSAGFDAHERDPLGQMMISEAGFEKMASIVREIAEETPARGRIVGLLEGGYNLEALASSAVAVMRRWDAERPLGESETQPRTVDEAARRAVAAAKA
jgi:acetoin utilization deacetylase AcuC-like enzyme